MAINEIERYPSNTNPEYVKARQALLEAEWALSKQIEKVAEMRRHLPEGAIMKDYVFDGPNGTKVSLADLAADGRSVVIYHLMFSEKDEQPCSMCAMFVDSQNGVGKHLAQLVNYAVVAKGPIGQVEDYANKRGWKDLKFLSSADNTFNKDMQVEYPKWAPDSYTLPGISVFRKDDEGNVRHVYSQSAHFEPNTQRGLDLLSPLYNVLDLVPEGRGDFYARNDYIFK
jgi:predicted dithiol-disulfide oxidoreductase (DUF899 family)